MVSDYRSIKHPLGLGLQDTWEDVDPDELSYEVSLACWSAGAFLLLIPERLIYISGVACIG